MEATAPVNPEIIKEKIEQQRTQELTVEEATWIAETITESGDFSFTDLEQAHERVRERQAGLERDQQTANEHDHD